MSNYNSDIPLELQVVDFLEILLVVRFEVTLEDKFWGFMKKVPSATCVY